jgi:hypothetical protein
MRTLFYFAVLVMSLQFSISKLQAQTFPLDWLGNYNGQMEIIHQKGTQQVYVELQLFERKADKEWGFKMTYFAPNQEKNVKDYVIRKTENGFVMDEQDGIEIQMTWIGNGFYDYYELDGRFFTSRLTKEKKGLFFELYGGEKIEHLSRNENLDISVSSFPPQFIQRVYLKKMK